MVTDPYQVLGVSKDASPDEIKRAYRRKAKEYHPDLHPDDPKATEKMNEVNVAYEMLTHPEKFRGGPQGNPYQGNPYQGGSYQSNAYQGGSYQDGSYQNNAYRNGSAQGGYSPFGFGFEEFFGFGSGQQAWQGQLHEDVRDNPYMRQAVHEINSRQYQMAINHLNLVTSAERSARWHFMTAVAHNGMGNAMMATEHMQRAVQMDPNNGLYHQLLNQYRAGASGYQNSAGQYAQASMMSMSQCLPICCLLNCLCRGCWI